MIIKWKKDFCKDLIFKLYLRDIPVIYLEITKIAIKGNNHQPDFLFDVDKYNTKWEVKKIKQKQNIFFQ